MSFYLTGNKVPKLSVLYLQITEAYWKIAYPSYLQVATRGAEIEWPGLIVSSSISSISKNLGWLSKQ